MRIPLPLFAIMLLPGCVSTVVGGAASLTGVIVTAPIKIAGKVASAAAGDSQSEKDRKLGRKIRKEQQQDR
jgi:hypothetical protein